MPEDRHNTTETEGSPPHLTGHHWHSISCLCKYCIDADQTVGNLVWRNYDPAALFRRWPTDNDVR